MVAVGLRGLRSRAGHYAWSLQGVAGTYEVTAYHETRKNWEDKAVARARIDSNFSYSTMR
jgi:hypothetical protein